MAHNDGIGWRSDSFWNQQHQDLRHSVGDGASEASRFSLFQQQALSFSESGAFSEQKANENSADLSSTKYLAELPEVEMKTTLIIEDWSNMSDPRERRRAQNRNAQRTYKEKMKRLEQWSPAYHIGMCGLAVHDYSKIIKGKENKRVQKRNFQRDYREQIGRQYEGAFKPLASATFGFLPTAPASPTVTGSSEAQKHIGAAYKIGHAPKGRGPFDVDWD